MSSSSSVAVHGGGISADSVDESPFQMSFSATVRVGTEDLGGAIRVDELRFASLRSVAVMVTTTVTIDFSGCCLLWWRWMRR